MGGEFNRKCSIRFRDIFDPFRVTWTVKELLYGIQTTCELQLELLRRHNWRKIFLFILDYSSRWHRFSLSFSSRYIVIKFNLLFAMLQSSICKRRPARESKVTLERKMLEFDLTEFLRRDSLLWQFNVLRLLRHYSLVSHFFYLCFFNFTEFSSANENWICTKRKVNVSYSTCYQLLFTCCASEFVLLSYKSVKVFACKSEKNTRNCQNIWSKKVFSSLS